jgi:hypothetical protein
MATDRRRDLRVGAAAAFVVLGAVAAMAVLLFSYRSARRLRAEDAAEPRLLTQPLRLEIGIPGASEEFLLGLRVYHYRAQPLGEARFADFFYDTDEWDLLRQGYSYRFRTRTQGTGASNYSLRMEQEPRFVPKGEKKLDLTSDLTDQLGDTIANGNWSLALRGGEGLEAPERLQEVLHNLGIDAKRVEPRLRGELRRGRFDITDKGQSWFELDREQWSFRLLDSEHDSGISFEDLVVDTRLKKKDPELFRRVHTMTEFARMLPGVRPAARAPHERAIELLVGEPGIE